MSKREIVVRHPEWIDGLVDYGRAYTDDDSRIRLAIALARENVLRDSGGPFGAAVFRADTGVLIGVGTNSVVRLNNSALHAEMVAFMMAQAQVGNYTLRGHGMSEHVLYTSCEPCAMCLGGALWSGVTRVVFAATREDARRLEFEEGPVFPESYAYLAQRGLLVEGGLLREEATKVFDLYRQRGGRIYNG
jgi:tRNA(Arg) A34 adenosine deaminase TadA